MRLYRPVGQKEFNLIEKSGFKEFPPRLDWQPIFYPVLNKDYAEQIASKWNTKDEFSEYIGYVLEFEVDDDYLLQFDVQTVGTSRHQEYWIPSDQLSEFNKHILEQISVIQKFKDE